MRSRQSSSASASDRGAGTYREPARTHGRVLVAEPACRLGVARPDRDAAQALVVLVVERPAADDDAAGAQLGPEGEMSILKLVRLRVCELRDARAARACAGRAACEAFDQCMPPTGFEPVQPP
jgi:hypothetical protein